MPATLRAGALSLTESTVMGLAGSAPAFSVATVLAVLLATARGDAITSLFVFAVPMLGIAVAYKGLNRRAPSAGAVYDWTTLAFGRLLGFTAGWAVLVSSLVSMVSNALTLGSNVLDLATPGGAGEPGKLATLAIGAAGFLLIGAVLVAGIGLTSRVQLLLTGVELLILAAIAVAAGVHVAHAGAVAVPHLAWSGPLATGPGFAAAALVVVFFYWGWDVTGNLAEETAGHPDNAAGQGGFLAVFLTVAIFLVFTLCSIALLTPAEAQRYGVNIVFGIAEHAGLGPVGARLAAFAVVLSTVATVETTMLQCSRGLFAMARDRAMPPSLERIHPATRTPVRAMLLILAVSLALLVGACFLPTVQTVVTDSVNAVAIQACTYYALAALVCAWEFRASRGRTWWGYCAFPFASAVALLVLGVYALTSFDRFTALVGVGGLVVGYFFFRPRGWKARASCDSTPPA